MAEYFEEKYDYSAPRKIPREREAGSPRASGAEAGEPGDVTGSAGEGQPPPPPRDIPTWEGTDVLASREAVEVGPGGEKVDVMTFRRSFECDLRTFAEQDAEMKAAIADEDDDAVET